MSLSVTAWARESQVAEVVILETAAHLALLDVIDLPASPNHFALHVAERAPCPTSVAAVLIADRDLSPPFFPIRGRCADFAIASAWHARVGNMEHANSDAVLLNRDDRVFTRSGWGVLHRHTPHQPRIRSEEHTSELQSLRHL